MKREKKRGFCGFLVSLFPKYIIAFTNMPRGGYYAVQNGRQTGVYNSWSECQAQTNGYSGAVYKKFSTPAEAGAFASGSGGYSGGLGRSTASGGQSYGRRSAGYGSTSSYTSPSTSGDNVVVYTDGASSRNGQRGARAGVGAYFGPNDSRNISEPLQGERQTNQRAELTAIKRTLETLPSSSQPINICTDSKYSIDSLTKWNQGWERNGWRNSKNQPVENQDLIKGTLDLVLNKHQGGVQFTHVRGHAGVAGNEAADKLAVNGSK